MIQAAAERPPITIGPFRLQGHALLAPMAGVTDLPFRRLCRRLGAALAAGEMLSADPRLWDTAESRRRRDHSDEPGRASCRSQAATRLSWPMPRVATSTPGRRSSTSTWVVRQKKSAIKMPVRRCCATKARRRNPASDGRRRGRTGDAEDTHGLGARPAQCRAHRAHGRGLRRASTGSARPHARVPFRRRRGIPRLLRLNRQYGFPSSPMATSTRRQRPSTCCAGQAPMA